MSPNLKKFIAGAVLAGTALTAGAALAQTSAGISKDDAKAVAQSGACAQAGTVKGDGSYNPNSKTWWFDIDAVKAGCSPACVVNAETKASEINWRCTGAIVPKKTEKKALDAACMGTAVAKRETAVGSAFSAKSGSISTAFAKRTSDLSAAWSLAAAKDRNAAIKAAWKSFNDAAAVARKAYRTANAAAWKAFRADAKACAGSTLQDSSQQGIDNNL